MNIKGIILSVRRYGLGGIVSYLLQSVWRMRFSLFLRSRMASQDPVTGITVIGCLDCSNALSKTLRDFVILLKKAGIPFQVLNLPCSCPIPEVEYQALLTPRAKFVTNKYSHVVTMRQPMTYPDRRCKVNVIEFWEFEDGYRESQPEMLRVENMIAMSDFNYRVFTDGFRHANVTKILYPFQFFCQRFDSVSVVRRKHRIPLEAFVVFFNFDFGSSYHRKNPEAILAAFAKAFSPTDCAVLVFKTKGAREHRRMLDRLLASADRMGLTDRLVLVNDFITQDELVGLTNACDVYVSLHRGEGFGLGVAEAMSLGKPVVVTDYSSTTEFCNQENSFPVPYRIVDVQPDQIDTGTYRHVSRWADPDVDYAAKVLQDLYANIELRKTVGARAQRFISEHFSVDNFRKSLLAFLEGRMRAKGCISK